jgi:hypothetical protein
MTQNLTHQAHVHCQPNNQHNRQTRTQLRADADSVLRDIAFVLKMTQKVRDEIEAEEEVEEALSV